MISKIDRVDAAGLEAARTAVHEMLAGAGYVDAPVIEASSITGSGISDVHAVIAAKAKARRDGDAQGGFRLAIDRSFSPVGAGLVVTGTAASGIVSVGDRLILSPAHLAARVRGIQVHNEAGATARAGDRCALAITGPRLERAALKRGDWLVDPSLHAPTQRIDVLIRAEGDRGLRHAVRVHIHFGTSSLTGRALMQKASDLTKGEEGFVTIALDKPGVCLHGDRLILRDESTGRVVAGGRVVDPFAPTRRVRREARAASLAALAITDPADSFRALLAAEGWADPRRFRMARNLPFDFEPQTDADAIRIGSDGEPILVSFETINRVNNSLIRHLAAWHATHQYQMGQGKAELVRTAGPVPANIVEAGASTFRVALVGTSCAKGSRGDCPITIRCWHKPMRRGGRASRRR